MHPSQHPSNTDVKQLHGLIQEMARTGYVDAVYPYFITDVEQLQEIINKMVGEITERSRDFYLKCIVGSVFDTFSVEDTIGELKPLNDGVQPDWLFTVFEPYDHALSVVYRSDAIRRLNEISEDRGRRQA